MKCFKPGEICDFLNKPEKDRSAEEQEKYAPVCITSMKLSNREFGGFIKVPLRIPESIHVSISPLGCVRHCQADILFSELEDRFYRLPLQEKEIVLGSADKILCKELDELLGSMKPEERPKVVTVTGTCIDALLHTDFQRVRKMLKEKYDCRMGEMPMFAIFAENTKNHGDILMEGLYSVIKPSEKKEKIVNIIGRSKKAEHNTDFYTLLEGAGYQIQQIHECKTLEDYDNLGKACLNVIVNKHSIYAAELMKKKLGIPYVKFYECFSLEEMLENYQNLEKALGIELDYIPFYEKAKEKLKQLKILSEGKTWAVGGKVDYNPMKFMRDFTKLGFSVKYLFGKTLKKSHLEYYEWFRDNTPDIDIYPLDDLAADDFFFHPVEADYAIGVESFRLVMAQKMKVIEIGEEPYDFETFIGALECIETAITNTEVPTWNGTSEKTMFDRKWNE